MQKRMLPLKARRPHLYGTRRLEAGDEYEAPVEEAVALVANGRAEFAKAKKKPPAPAVEEHHVAVAEQAEATAEPAHQQENHEPSDNALARLRAEALELGVDVDGRWGVARLQYEIDKVSAANPRRGGPSHTGNA